jgi:hypothetical protein
MLCLDICSFPLKHVYVVFPLLSKKKSVGEKDADIYSCISLFRYLMYFYLMSQFLVNHSFFFYITKSSCLISAKFPCCIYLIDSCFSHVMKICIIQGFLKVHFFLSDF